MTRSLIVSLLCGLLLPGAALAAPQPLDRIAVVINDGVIVETEVQRALTQAFEQIRGRGINPPAPEVLRPQVIERLILMRVQTQRAQQAGLRIDDRELNDVLTNIARENGMTLSQFADALRAEGTDYLSVREQVRDELMVNRLRSREVDSRVMVTDQDIELFLASQPEDSDVEYRLGHILVSLPDGVSPEGRTAARRKIDDLRTRIAAGEDFAALAITESDGQQALSGGDLGFRTPDALPQVFASAAARLDVGEVSPVIEAGNGFHLIRMNERRGGATPQSVEETHARHLLIQSNPLRDEEQTRRLARQLHARITEGGEVLGDLAAEFSDDPGSKNNKGDLGFQPPGMFVPEFQTRLDQLQPGQISEPFRSQFGWHIVEVVERRTRDITEESRRARARAALQNRRATEEYDTWLRRLRAEAYIEYRVAGDQPEREG